MTGLQKQAGLTNDPSTRFGTTLTIGLLDEHHWLYGVQLACRERSQPEPIRLVPLPQVSSSTAPPPRAGLVANQRLDVNPLHLNINPPKAPFELRFDSTQDPELNGAAQGMSLSNGMSKGSALNVKR